MKPLRIFWVGKHQHRFISDGVAYYQKLLNPLQPVELVEIRDAVHSGRDPQAAIKREGEALLKRIGGGETVVLLDEKGKQFSTREWAAMMGRLREESGNPVCLIVGGAYGVADAVKQRSNHIVALSRLTFPHQLARVVLMEQLYRIYSLITGRAYNHD